MPPQAGQASDGAKNGARSRSELRGRLRRQTWIGLGSAGRVTDAQNVAWLFTLGTTRRGTPPSVQASILGAEERCLDAGLLRSDLGCRLLGRRRCARR